MGTLNMFHDTVVSCSASEDGGNASHSEETRNVHVVCLGSPHLAMFQSMAGREEAIPHKSNYG